MTFSLRLISFLLFSSLAINSWSQQSEEIASNYLLQNQSDRQQKLTKENLIVSSSHTSQQSGLTYIYFNQAHDGIKIYNAITNVAVDKSGSVFHTGDRFVNFKPADKSSPSINALDAIQRTASHFKLEDKNQTTLIRTESGVSNKASFRNESLSNRDITTELIYVHQNGKLILCWSVAIEKSDDHFYWDVKVSASSGEIIEKTSWTVECNFSHGQDACDHSGHEHTIHGSKASAHSKEVSSKKSFIVDGDYTVIPMPFESPSHGPITVVNSPWSNNIDVDAHPFNWHNDGLTTYFTTHGNNVWAVEDADGDNNQNTGFSPDSELANVGQQYNFIPDFSLSPPDYQEAAITNLFYWNNIVHDVMFHYGFDEASGNFQQTNPTGSGIGSDAVQADAQDGSGLGNATFSTPADGSKPRMTMFQWAPDPVITLDVITPTSASYVVAGANFGPNATFSGTVVDAFDMTGGTQEACTANPISNGAALSGNIALIDRGICTFVEKVTNAEAEGAIAVIVCNNIPGNPSQMGGTAPFPSIPSVMLSQTDCMTLRTMLPATINVAAIGGINRDSDYDNGVIIHEYGHGISTRLTGGAGTSGCLDGNEQMGEGWSDYFGLIMTMKAGDTGTDARGVGTYVLFQPVSGSGIRPYQYSTDFAVNPLTYGFTDDGGAITVPHGVGSVWCTMLWEMTWDLIGIYGIGTNIYDSDINNAGTAASPSTFGGQNLALQLVIEGLKLQPCNPGFVDGRDAILAADNALYGGIHTCVIWEAFARRGLGPKAEQGSSSTLSDNIESFDYSPFTIEKTVNPSIVSNGGTATYTIDIQSCGTATDLVITDILDPAFTINSMVCPSPAVITNSGNTVTITHPNVAEQTNFACDIIVIANGTTSGSMTNLLSDDVESGNIGWTINNIQGSATDEWAIVNTASNSPSNSWFVVDTDGPDRTHALESPILALGQNPILSFSHSYNTEAGWDGGYIEVSINNGASWEPLDPTAAVQNGYNSVLGASSNNYIANKPAWSGNSNGFVYATFNLNEYANENAKIRFLYGQDDNTNDAGWWIDDISIEGYESIVNEACLVANQLTTPICDDVIIFVEMSESCNGPCDDNDPCTEGETYDTNCNCVNGIFQDSDSDGVCDADDKCMGLDDALIGTLCDDGDACTEGETYDANCNCSNGIFQDSDNDGVCDADDKCIGIDDALIGTLCDDGDACTEGEIYDANCNCINGIFQDSDNDGVCDADDKCIGIDDALIGTLCDDGDECTEGETYDGSCNCTNGIFQDSDNDGICDALDSDGCSALFSDDFESDAGIWIVGGIDAERIMSSNSPRGNYSMRIRDNSNLQSSIYTSTLDLSQAYSAKISFLYQSIAMESGKSFVLELSSDNGLTFSTIQEWTSGTDFFNDIIYEEIIEFHKSQISSTTIFRLRCNGTINADEIYLDDIRIISCELECQDYVVDSSNLHISESIQSKNGITTNGIITSPNEIEFIAGEFILLTENFEVKAQAVFHAYIEGCSN